MDSNQRRRKPTDLQSAPFSHSGTPPQRTDDYGGTPTQCQALLELCNSPALTYIVSGKTQKPHLFGVGFLLLLGSLTITYFHTGIRTIIGVESFHGPVRDGKGWDRLAMVIRHDLLSRGLSRGRTTNREEVAERMPLVGGLCCFRHNTDLKPCVLRPPSGVHTHPLRGSDPRKR